MLPLWKDDRFMQGKEEQRQKDQRKEASIQDVATRWVEAFNTRNLEAITALYVADAELYDSGMHRARRGQKEIASWFRLRFGSMPGNVYTPEAYHQTDEEHISVEWSFAGRSPQLLGWSRLARPFRVQGTSYFSIRDNGLIYKQRGIYDHLVVLRQILPWLPTPLLRGVYALYLLRHHQW